MAITTGPSRQRLSDIQWVALVGGAAVGIYQTAILIEHAGQDRLAIAGAILTTLVLAAALPLAEALYHRRQWLMAAGLGLVWLGLAATCLPPIVSRYAAPRDAVIAQETARANRLRDLRSDLERTRLRVTDAEVEAKAESKRGGCKTTCQSWQRTARERQARADQLGREIAALEAQTTAGNGDMRRLASISGISEALLATWMPLIGPISLEVAVWVLVWIGLSPSLMRQVPAPATAAVAAWASVPVTAGASVAVTAGASNTAAPVASAASGPSKPRGGRKRRDRRNPNVVEFVAAYQARHGHPPSGREVQEACPHVSRATAYRYAGPAAAAG